MANFGSFEYGTGVVYGSSSAEIDAIDILDQNKIRVTFTNPVVINEALVDVENYVIEFSDNPGFTDVEVLEVLPSVPDTSAPDKTQVSATTTTELELLTSYHSPGQSYDITISNLLASDGSGVPSVTNEAVARRTKVETILRSLPAHFDKRPGSNIRSTLTAIGIEDDRIGGSLIEDIPL